MVVSDLAMAVKELGELDTATLTDDELSELMVDLHRVRTALEAQHARVARAWDTRRVWAADGARSGAAWMGRHTRAPKPDYGGLLWLAQRMNRFPQIYAAWEAGEVTRDHVARLVRAWSPRVDSEYVRDATLLVHQARTLTFAEFTQALDYWLLRADPDGTSEEHEERRHRRRVALDETVAGMWSGSLLLDPVSGTIVSTELRRLEQALFAADWKEAKETLGRDPSVFDLARTPELVHGLARR